MKKYKIKSVPSKQGAFIRGRIDKSRFRAEVVGLLYLFALAAIVAVTCLGLVGSGETALTLKSAFNVVKGQKFESVKSALTVEFIAAALYLLSVLASGICLLNALTHLKNLFKKKVSRVYGLNANIDAMDSIGRMFSVGFASIVIVHLVVYAFCGRVVDLTTYAYVVLALGFGVHLIGGFCGGKVSVFYIDDEKGVSECKRPYGRLIPLIRNFFQIAAIIAIGYFFLEDDSIYVFLRMLRDGNTATIKAAGVAVVPVLCEVATVLLLCGMVIHATSSSEYSVEGPYAMGIRNFRIFSFLMFVTNAAAVAVQYFLGKAQFAIEGEGYTYITSEPGLNQATAIIAGIGLVMFLMDYILKLRWTKDAIAESEAEDKTIIPNINITTPKQPINIQVPELKVPELTVHMPAPKAPELPPINIHMPAAQKQVAPAPITVNMPAAQKQVAPAPINVTMPNAQRQVAPAPITVTMPNAQRQVAPAPINVTMPNAQRQVAPAPINVTMPNAQRQVAPAPINVTMPNAQRQVAPAPINVMMPNAQRQVAPAPINVTMPNAQRQVAPAPINVTMPNAQRQVAPAPINVTMPNAQRQVAPAPITVNMPNAQRQVAPAPITVNMPNGQRQAAPAPITVNMPNAQAQAMPAPIAVNMPMPQMQPAMMEAVPAPDAMPMGIRMENAGNDPGLDPKMLPLMPPLMTMNPMMQPYPMHMNMPMVGPMMEELPEMPEMITPAQLKEELRRELREELREEIKKELLEEMTGKSEPAKAEGAKSEAAKTEDKDVMVAPMVIAGDDENDEDDGYDKDVAEKEWSVKCPACSKPVKTKVGSVYHRCPTCDKVFEMQKVTKVIEDPVVDENQTFDDAKKPNEDNE